MLEILWGLPVAAASLLFQIRPRIGNRHFGVDTWRHLAIAEHYRRRRRGEAAEFDQYILPEPSDYPPLLRGLLSLFPKQAVDRWQWVISPLFDAAHSVLLFAVAYSLSGNLSASLAAQGAYALAPLIVMENSSLSTRSMAALLFSSLMVPHLAYHASGSWIWLPVSVAVSTVLFLTHRMALQALAAVTVALSLWFLTPYYLASFAAAWLAALVVSRGFYWRVFTGHLAMLWWWRGNIHNRYAHQIRGLSPRAGQSGDPVFRIYEFVRRMPFIAVLAANAFVVFPVLVAIDRGFGSDFVRSLAWDRELAFMLVWTLALLATGVLIRQVRAVEWLGEGERYGEYAAFPTALALTAVVTGMRPDLAWAAWTLFAVVALVGGLAPSLYLQQNVVARDTSRSLTPALREVLAAIDRLEPRARLMTFPLFLADFALYFTRARVLSTDSSLGHLHHYDDIWPVLQRPLPEILGRYDVDHVLVNESYVGLDELGLDQAPIRARSQPFCLVDVRSVRASSS